MLNSNVFTEKIDIDTYKFSNDRFEIYIKNEIVSLVVDKRNPKLKCYYNDLQTAYVNTVGSAPHDGLQGTSRTTHSSDIARTSP
jgi:hypothetical protein